MGLKIPKVMIAAVKSGSGKTTITCAFLKQLLCRKKHPVSFKCGPDYIDPMFHEQVLKIPSKNLDTFFSDASQIQALYEMELLGHDIAVLEGVMGLYDGLGGIREEGSSYHLAKTLDVPVILVVDAHGMGKSVIPLIAGFLQYDEKKLIKGVILNRTSKMFFDTIAPLIEEELAIKALGCIPNEKELTIGSRHLGLILPEEMEELNFQLEKAGQLLEKYVDVDAMIGIAECALREKEETVEDDETKLEDEMKPEKNLEEKEASGKVKIFLQAISNEKNKLYDIGNSDTNTIPPRIAVAKDEAFCFYYRDNLRMLEHYGAELVFFSPLHDEKLPENIHGILLGGGYPELYASQLEENESMRKSIKEALEQQLPSLAECGGFMYLHDTLTDREGTTYQMAGVIPAECQYTGKLVRFGYVEVQLPQGLTEKGTAEMPEPEKIKAHEFHYFDSTANGEDCIATKPVTGRSWKCIHASDDHFWGFPHLYYPSDPKFVKWFLERAEKHI
jgi:cobyrinic acid a,c-diamide synthase